MLYTNMNEYYYMNVQIVLKESRTNLMVLYNSIFGGFNIDCTSASKFWFGSKSLLYRLHA